MRRERRDGSAAESMRNKGDRNGRRHARRREESADDAGEDGEWKKTRRWRCPFAEASEESAGERV